nr:hypothetical protein [uncultured Campylobacter sp.]
MPQRVVARGLDARDERGGRMATMAITKTDSTVETPAFALQIPEI